MYLIAKFGWLSPMNSYITSYMNTLAKLSFKAA